MCRGFSDRPKNPAPRVLLPEPEPVIENLTAVKAYTMCLCCSSVGAVGFLVASVAVTAQSWPPRDECTIEGAPVSHTHLALYVLVATIVNCVSMIAIPFGLACVRPYPHMTPGKALCWFVRWIPPMGIGVWGMLETVGWVCGGAKRNQLWTIAVMSATFNLAYVGVRLFIILYRRGVFNWFFRYLALVWEYIKESQRP